MIRWKIGSLAVLSAWAVGPGLGAAAPKADSDPAFGHSVHGEVFNEGPRQKAVRIPGTGEVSFPVTTKSKQAQAFFDQGIGQLHGFWDFEAERSFRQVASLDPDCAMAYWGMAMANLGNAKRAAGFVAEAVDRKDEASEREQRWIESLAKVFPPGDKDAKPSADEKKVRLRNLVRDLEKLVADDPDDIEAKAILLKQIYYNNGKGLPINSHLVVDLLANAILEAQPNHPSHHFRIHLWDRENAANALASAAACGSAAPGIAHMWHMPGHIYSRLHRYHDAVWQQEASARIDHAHMMRYRIVPDRIHNFAHNNEWLIRNLNFIGRVGDAIDLACNMIELPRLPKFTDKKYSHSGGSWSYGRQRLRDTLLRFELWEELLEFGGSHYLKPDTDAVDETEWHRLLGIAAFELGRVKAGAEHLAALEKRVAETGEKRAKAEQSARTKAEKAKKAKKDIDNAVAQARKNFAKELAKREAARDELRVCALLFGDEAGRDRQAARDLLGEKSLATMDGSRKARLWLLAGATEKAVRSSKAAVEASPSQVQPLANRVDILWSAHREKEALAAFGKLRELATAADFELPVLRRLEPVAAAAGFAPGDDWRLPFERADDFGERPELASLGPFRWHPPKAPAWSLTDAEGKRVSLRDYRGKPVVVIFYLGRGCTHCMEQLNAFAPKDEEFREAGIDIVAVSTDTTEGLKITYQISDDDAKNPFPFPLVSDAKLSAFHAYRAYDDFEDMALHGTYLIDGRGRIRWQNISYEPFMEPAFLLEECERLLSYGEDS